MAGGHEAHRAALAAILESIAHAVLLALHSLHCRNKCPRGRSSPWPVKPITIGDQQYHVVLVPSAPVPVGGCLVYVPVEWVKPADFGIEALMSIYVSMGVTSPQIVEWASTMRS